MPSFIAHSAAWTYVWRYVEQSLKCMTIKCLLVRVSVSQHITEYDCNILYIPHRPRFGWVHPLNLSISVSGGKEIKRDSLSKGDRTENSSTHSRLSPRAWSRCWVGKTVIEYGISTRRMIVMMHRRGVLSFIRMLRTPPISGCKSYFPPCTR